MISDDIIKKIKFVFAGDNKDLKKTLDETNKAASALAKNFDLEKQSKVLDKFIKNLSGTNKELTKTMQGIQKGFRDIAEKDFEKFTKKVEGAYKSLQETQRKIEAAQRAGDTAEIQRLQKVQKYQQSNMTRNMNQANNSAGAAGGGGGQPPGGLLTQLSGLGAVVGTGYAAMRSLSTIPNFARSAGEMTLNNQASLAGLGRNNLQRYLSGDLGQEFVLGKNKGAANTEVLKALEAGTASRAIGSGIPGGLKGAWNVVANNPLKFFDNEAMAQGFENGARGQFTTQTETDRQELINKRVANSIDPVYLQSIQQNAASRFGMQSSFNMSDREYSNTLNSLKGSRMSESEMMNFSMQNRGVLGNAASARLANAPGMIRNTTGMGMDVSNSLLQATALNGNNAMSEKDQVIQMYAKGFENGIKDSGLLEGILKGTASIAQSFGSRIDMARMSGDIASVANQIGDGARGMQGTMDAKNFYENMSDSNDEMGLHKQAYAVEVTKHIKNRTAREALRNYISSKKPEEIKQLAGNEEFMSSAAANGATPEELATLTGKTSSNLFEDSQMNMTAPSRKLKSDIKAYALKNGVSEAEATRRLSLVRTGALTGNYGSDTSRVAMGSFLTGNRAGTDGSTFDPNALGKDLANTQSGAYTSITSDRQNEFNKSAMDKVDVRDINDATVSQKQTFDKTGGTMGLGGSVTDLVRALQRFAEALQTDTPQNWTRKPGGQ